MKLEFEWEELERQEIPLGAPYSNSHRAKVIGGWLVRHYWQASGTSSLVFIPDEYHTWEVTATAE